MNTPNTTLTSPCNLGIVLVEPRIPQNVGNIGRLCACTGAHLILVGDLGFSLAKKDLRRSGMDYLEYLTPQHFPDFPDVLDAYSGWTFSFLSTKANHVYTQIPFAQNHLLVFGSESQGLPEAILTKYADKSFRIPMLEDRRSLNLSTSVGIVLYEGLRQLDAFQAPIEAPCQVG